MLVNGKQLDWKPPLTVEELLADLDSKGTLPMLKQFYDFAVILDGQIVSPIDYAATLVHDDSIVEIIPLLGGG